MRVNVQALGAPNDAAREALLQYAAQIDRVASKLPVSESQIRINFAWDDAFTAKRVAGQFSWEYERAAVLFNVAALESQRGAAIVRTSKDAIKAAAKHFQAAAGLFQYIRDRIVPGLLGALPLDLSPQGLNFLMNLMLAQAQVCFLEMAMHHLGYPPERLVPIALGAADMFREAVKAVPAATMRSIEKDYPYTHHLEVQAASLDSIGYFRHAETVYAR